MKCHDGVDAFMVMVTPCEAAGANISDVEIIHKLFARMIGLDMKIQLKADYLNGKRSSKAKTFHG